MSQPQLPVFQGKALEDSMVKGGVVMVDERLLTAEDLKKALPPQLNTKITPELVDKINSIAMDPDEADNIRDNIVSYTSVLKEGKFKIEQYLEAAAYVTFKMMGYKNYEAYAKTFPDRISRLRSEGKDDRYISSFVAAYNKNKLVNAIFEQTLIAPWILNRDVHQAAINRLAHLMMDAKSEKVQCDAAAALVKSLTPPEATKVDLNIGIKEDSGMKELKGMLADVATRQQELIESGATTKEIAHKNIFEDLDEVPDAEVVE